jgi:hypothetical protein
MKCMSTRAVHVGTSFLVYFTAQCYFSTYLSRTVILRYSYRLLYSYTLSNILLQYILLSIYSLSVALNV